jgi:hypothetical protein
MCVATVWETLSEIGGGHEPDPRESDGRVDSFWGVVELVFTILFSVEVILKLIVYGWHAYWMDLTNRYVCH